jgi:hypothetical protein
MSIPQPRYGGRTVHWSEPKHSRRTSVICQVHVIPREECAHLWLRPTHGSFPTFVLRFQFIITFGEVVPTNTVRLTGK